MGFGIGPWTSWNSKDDDIHGVYWLCCSRDGYFNAVLVSVRTSEPCVVIGPSTIKVGPFVSMRLNTWWCRLFSCSIFNRVFANRFLTHRHTIHAVEQTVEWQYAFDVHCNSFFPLFLILYVLQFFLMPVLSKELWVCLFIGNTMYIIAIIYYCYITFLGYSGKYTG